MKNTILGILMGITALLPGQAFAGEDSIRLPGTSGSITFDVLENGIEENYSSLSNVTVLGVRPFGEMYFFDFVATVKNSQTNDEFVSCHLEVFLGIKKIAISSCDNKKFELADKEIDPEDFGIHVTGKIKLN